MDSRLSFLHELWKIGLCRVRSALFLHQGKKALDEIARRHLFQC